MQHGCGANDVMKTAEAGASVTTKPSRHVVVRVVAAVATREVNRQTWTKVHEMLRQREAGEVTVTSLESLIDHCAVISTDRSTQTETDSCRFLLLGFWNRHLLRARSPHANSCGT